MEPFPKSGVDATSDGFDVGVSEMELPGNASGVLVSGRCGVLLSEALEFALPLDEFVNGLFEEFPVAGVWLEEPAFPPPKEESPVVYPLPPPKLPVKSLLNPAFV